jgi:4-diphosphocytidyl-2-C-methyl-D-erythritol kinase
VTGSGSTLTLESPAKINWWLRVLDRRPDGYHELETIYQRLTLADTISVTALEEGPPWRCEIEGMPSDLPPEQNLIHKAWRALGRLVGPDSVGSFHFQVEKRIPAGGGLGGGSSNAATALRAMVRLRNLVVDQADLHDLAAGLGADVPFFLSPCSAAVGRGRGTDLSPIEGAAEGLPLVLAFPGEGMSTAEAYKKLSGISRPGPDWTLDDLVQGLVRGDWSDVARYAHNDFEKIQGTRFGDLARCCGSLGAERVLLCGSGSSIAILFSEALAARNLLDRGPRRELDSYTLHSAFSRGPVG